MCFHSLLLTDCFITEKPGIQTQGTMYTHMFLYINLQTECFFTHITGIRMLGTMYKVMSAHMRLLTE